MKIVKSSRGFMILTHPEYTSGYKTRLAQESSAIDGSERGLAYPGSSYLWIGEKHHLSRDEVRVLVYVLSNWLSNGEFDLPAKGSIWDLCESP